MINKDINKISIGFCKYCAYKRQYGQYSTLNKPICDCPKISDEIFMIKPKEEDCLEYSYNEQGDHHPGDYFGCIHFKQKETK